VQERPTERELKKTFGTSVYSKQYAFLVLLMFLNVDSSSILAICLIEHKSSSETDIRLISPKYSPNFVEEKFNFSTSQKQALRPHTDPSEYNS
jgi:hypothetical protein